MDLYRKLGLASLEIAACFENLGVRLVRSGQRQAGRNYILQASAMDNAMIAQALSIASEDARIEFLEAARSRLNDLVSLVARGGPFERDDTTLRACADVVFCRKRAALEALAAQRDLAASGRYPQLAERLRELSRVRMQLAQMILSGRALRQGGAYVGPASELAEAKRRLEQEIGREVPDVALDEQLQRADREAIARHLPADSVLVEFLRFKFFPYQPTDQMAKWEADRYAAFVLPTGRPDPSPGSRQRTLGSQLRGRTG